MPFLETSSSFLHYDVHGIGEPVVFIHGAGANSLAWFQQIAHFSKRYKCIALDLRGFNQSRCAPEDAHPRFFPDDLLALLDFERIDKASLVCQSMGAWAGLPLAVRHPERVRALVLSGSPTPAFGEHHDVLRVVADRFRRIQLGQMVPMEDLGFSPQFLAERPDLVLLYRMFSRLNSLECAPHSHIHAHELRLMPEDLAGYSVPTMVMSGKLNKLLGPDIHLRAARCIPGATTYTFEASGHSSYYEEPTHYNTVVERFLGNNV
ncbi:alpha/beta fold hydrolase [Burkholderia cepacia]|uniref:alpha/beta fold hydrolase n=1 Tax=Burkholderia cepacia TaxID=292 RepID=UPI001F3F4C1A|nr:alpha/beta hydrolase [Burkholderia cepacia]MCE4124393.1 alpha/beta hydrolase [Burkholderia cepacia]